MERLASDHYPLLVRLQAEFVDFASRNVQSQSAWLKHLGFLMFVRDKWELGSLTKSLLILKESFLIRNQDVFGNIYK